MNEEDYLDNLNDLVAYYCIDEEELAQHEVNRYCEEWDLDPDGYELAFEGECWVVGIADF